VTARTDPSSDVGLALSRASALLRAGQFAAAESLCRQALAHDPQAPAALHLLGVCLLQQARYAEAEQALAACLRLQPDEPAALGNRGIALQGLGRFDEALTCYAQSLARAPGQPATLNMQGLALLELKRYDEALASFDQALAVAPAFAEAWCNRANALIHRQRFDEALASLDRAEALRPDYGEALSNRSLVLNLLGRHDQALAAAQRAAALLPGRAVVHRHLAEALAGLGRLDEALPHYDRAIALDPRDGLAYQGRGHVRLRRNAPAQALPDIERALGLRGDSVSLLCDLAQALRLLGRRDEASAALDRALARQERSADALRELADMLIELQRYDEAIAALNAAIASQPDDTFAHNNLGGLCQLLGRLDEAEGHLRRAIATQPDFLEIQSNLLFLHAYQARLSPAEELREAREYGRRAAVRAPLRFRDWDVTPEPARLRVGLVSGDLREHPVGYFLEGLLAHLDPACVELVAYPTQPAGDALTERIRPRFAAWSPLHGLSDAEAARRIHADRIHVLIDLAGHTAHNRLPMFACRPAPVQVTWLGYFATTGVAEIDYLLADLVSVPPAHRSHFSETVWYLPQTRLCFTPPRDAPEVAPLPARRHGYVTFGSFQNLAKVNDGVLALWSRVLAEVRQARLLLHSKPLADPAFQEQFAQRLRRAGIAVERVSMHGALPRAAYLAAHAEVDLILDTFPFPGGTTTCEALWMGVPTLTLAGDRLIGRQGASLLAAVGLHDWIAATPAEYVDKAIAFAADLEALATLRSSLRGRLRSSSLCDAPRFARHLEEALWAMWRRQQGDEA
jgi:predicted O-linked N-acetylglucosamine transferase (SPINDLY family)